jgi:two-component system response regulator HydG
MAMYSWPGNVRELRNLIESMAVQDHDGILNLDDLQDGDPLSRLQASGHRLTSPASLVGQPLAEVERYYIEQALKITKNNREEAAKMLGIGERTLYRKIQRWGLLKKRRNHGDGGGAEEDSTDNDE